MKLLLFALAFSILLLTGCRSAPPPQANAPSPPTVTATTGYPNLMVQAKQLETAVSTKDYARITDLTYAKSVEIGGGREKFLSEMTRGMKTMEAEGVFLLSSTVSEPSQFVSDANGIYAVVPVTTKIKAQGGVFQTEGTIIGISSDGGQNWTFVDATGRDQSELRAVLPNFDKLNVPPEKAPVK